MSEGDWGDWLQRWWGTQWDICNAAAPSCHICDALDELMLLRRPSPGRPIIFDDVIPLCQRCAGRVEQLLNDRCAPGATWTNMPRQLAVDAIVQELGSGATPLEPEPGE